MSPFLETFGNASKRGWAVASLGINGWFGYITTGETYGYGSGFDAQGNVYASIRDQTDGAVGLMMKFNGETGLVTAQKRANTGTVAPGGGASDGTNFYAGFGSRVIKFDSSLNEVYSYNESGGGQFTVNQPNGSYMALGVYAGSQRAALYNVNGTKLFYVSGSGVTNGWAATAAPNGYVYVMTTASGPTPNIAVLNSSGAKVTDISPQASGESFSYDMTAVTDASNNCVICYNGTTGRFLIKYNTSGGIVWQRKITGTSINSKPITGVDSAGNVYVSFVNATANYPLFILKYNSSGTLLWQRSITKATGNFYGTETGTIGFTSDGKYLSIAGNGGAASGTGNAFVIKLATTGAGLGTYAVNGNNWTYAASSLTDAAASTTVSTAFGGSWSSYASTQTSSSPGYTATSFGWTSKVF